MSSPIVLNTEAARKQDGEKPQVNWGVVSIASLKSMGRYRIKPTRLNMLTKLLNEGRLPDKHVDELLELSEVDWEAEAQADWCKLFASCVLSVPRDWFADDAPKKLDFADAKTYEYLRVSRLQELTIFISNGDDASGN